MPIRIALRTFRKRSLMFFMDVDAFPVSDGLRLTCRFLRKSNKARYAPASGPVIG